jgi:hypothetical protein
MPFLAITSDRRCDVQPSDRSPGTAAHHAGAGEASHDWIGEAAGDCATMRHALPDAAAIVSAQTTFNDDVLMRSFFLWRARVDGHHDVPRRLERALHPGILIRDVADFRSRFSTGWVGMAREKGPAGTE